MTRLLLMIVASVVLITQARGNKEYSRHGWWGVSSLQTDDGTQLCQMSTMYGATYFSLSARYRDGARVWSLILVNESWQWVMDGGRYEGMVQSPTGGPWQVAFDTIADGEVRALRAWVSKDFVNALAMDRKGRTAVFRVGGRMLGTYRLDDSAAAIRDVVHCVNATRLASLSQPAKAQERKSSGTGFFVSDGHVVTNHHVVRGCGEIYVGYAGYPAERASLVGQDENNDLAVLKTDMHNNGVATLRYGVRLGEPVASFGFPLAGLLADEGNFTLGNVTAVAGIGGDTRFFQVSAPFQAGNSGGPVMDATGVVLGVAKAVLRQAGADDLPPQNVNFALAAPIVVNFLTVKGVKWSSRSGGEKLESEKLAEFAKTFTVRVTCR